MSETEDVLMLLNEAISLGRRDGMCGQHLDAMCSARDAIERLEAENADLKTSVIAFGTTWATDFARGLGWPRGHLHPTHYDMLEKAGARMDDFVRHPLSEPPQDSAWQPSQDGSDA